MAERVQLSRRKGFRLPPNTVSVARPGKFGNPFVIGKTYPVREGSFEGPEIGSAVIADARDAADAFRGWVESGGSGLPLEQLRGKNLACWCKIGSPCHADVLLELANREPEA